VSSSTGSQPAAEQPVTAASGKQPEDTPAGNNGPAPQAEPSAEEPADAGVQVASLAPVDEPAELTSPFVEGAPVTTLRRRPRPDAPLHWFLLVLCVSVVVIACVLTVPGQGRTNEVALFGGVIPELCTSKRFLNRECPGCGMTRCFISLAHLDISRAWAFNPAGIYLFGIMLFQIPYRIIQLARIYTGRMPYDFPRLAWVMWLLPVFLLGNWIIQIWA